MTCPARKVWPSCFRSKLNSGEYILGEEPKLDQALSEKDFASTYALSGFRTCPVLETQSTMSILHAQDKDYEVQDRLSGV